MTIHLCRAGVVSLLIHSVVFSQAGERLSLKEAVNIALERNPRILTATQEIEAADGRIRQAGRISNPTIAVSWNEIPTNFNIGEADERDIGITQEVEFPTRRSARIDVATYDREISELHLDRIKTMIATEAKKAYYETLFSQEIINSLEEQLRLLQDVQKSLSDRYNAGTNNYLDVIRGKVEIARLTNDIAEAKRGFRTKMVQLNLLLGNAADRALVLTDSLIHGPAIMDEDSLVRAQLERSSTLRIARRNVVRQEAAVGLAKASYFPDLSLGIFHQRRAEEPPFDANHFTGTTSNAMGIEVGLSIPLWFWQEPKGEVQEASALRSIAELNSSQIAIRVRASILNAINAVRVSEGQLRVFDQSLLRDSKDIVATGLVHYQNNQLDLLNLLDVYRTARATQAEYARALLNYVMAVADLEAAGELPLEQQQ